jgi:hypothetical protein
MQQLTGKACKRDILEKLFWKNYFGKTILEKLYTSVAIRFPNYP